ncbi:MAG: LON peptidase substrate-binding domain-containing protein [Akkermansiaceae bacterium]|jgi:uncharacterized protein|nr:LON peptidase substrate-binding domain-containing protein [Akkermansiaceae bacterium]MDP4720453.1 LON peptidase substrate-binding domain-containing protein [Akkermansiaceae bacterium]MDP4779153.1 LON peptidase substrate-binding domain-containing protein [Akkermansiaceae bacterium]MDP4848234.1 LON peptidase substrate-binding domain-containing protein [Akkermansiaceae bacterium]MDP4898593.1 LON peptidase substrate-binding domain-containing protein [Akkermansiaceae bacterium]
MGLPSFLTMRIPSALLPMVCPSRRNISGQVSHLNIFHISGHVSHFEGLLAHGSIEVGQDTRGKSWVSGWLLRGARGGARVAAMTGLNLPKKCGVMLLPDCTLFPHGGLPLYIFEERYRIMLEEALAGECVFAVGRVKQSQDGGEDIISEIGTAGLVRASREGDDGTSQLLLHGVIRVRFKEWLEEKPYPYALIEPVITTPLPEEKSEAAMKTLRGVVEDATEKLPLDIRSGVATLLGQADEPALMADLVAQQFVHEPDLRQILLETKSVGEMMSLLCAFFEGLEMGD